VNAAQAAPAPRAATSAVPAVASTPGSSDPFQSLSAELQSFMVQSQNGTSTAGTATAGVGEAHHHHHQGGGGLLAALNAATSTTGTSSITGTATSAATAPLLSAATPASAATQSQLLAADIQQALQAYGSTEAAAVQPSFAL